MSCLCSTTQSSERAHRQSQTLLPLACPATCHAHAALQQPQVWRLPVQQRHGAARPAEGAGVCNRWVLLVKCCCCTATRCGCAAVGAPGRATFAPADAKQFSLRSAAAVNTSCPALLPPLLRSLMHPRTRVRWLRPSWQPCPRLAWWRRPAWRVRSWGLGLSRGLIGAAPVAVQAAATAGPRCSRLHGAVWSSIPPAPPPHCRPRLHQHQAGLQLAGAARHPVSGAGERKKGIIRHGRGLRGPAGY